jgi:hypothetical protein
MVDAPDAGATPFLVCEPPMKTCNPVGTAADCGNAALGCYVLSSGATGCDCKGTAQPGQACDLYNSCIPGYRCVTLSGSNSGACFKACALKGADCTAPSTCLRVVGDTYGYCSP